MAELTLTDGNTWGLAADGEQASAAFSRLTQVLQLRPHRGAVRKLVILTGDDLPTPTRWAGLPAVDREMIYCALRPAQTDGEMVALALWQLARIIGKDVQKRGGVLLHGALAEWKGACPEPVEGQGVILAGPNNMGKTTASQRLQAPWRSLCDDTTLVVRDWQGTYWAHPWPTVSLFTLGEPGGSWDVQRAVPLKGIFFLTQAQQERAELVGAGQSVTLLVESAKQAAQIIVRDLDAGQVRALRLECFDNLCALAQAVPTCILHLSLTGAFWEEMERVLAGNARP